MSALEPLVLDAAQVEDVLWALGTECAMEKTARGPGQESCVALFRRRATSDEGILQFQFHPQKLAGRAQTVVLRPDLTIEVWAHHPHRPYEDFETTTALEPVRERLDILARDWGLRGPESFVSFSPTQLAAPRERLSGLAERRELVLV